MPLIQSLIGKTVFNLSLIFQESDYRVDEELNRLVLEESELRDADAAKKSSHGNDDDDGKATEDPGAVLNITI